MADYDQELMKIAGKTSMKMCKIFEKAYRSLLQAKGDVKQHLLPSPTPQQSDTIEQKFPNERGGDDEKVTHSISTLLNQFSHHFLGFYCPFCAVVNANAQ